MESIEKYVEENDIKGYLNYMYSLLYNLTTHNKNYTKEQEYEIYTLKSIIENMEVA